MDILRPFDPREIAQALIKKGKSGWEPDNCRTPLENLWNFFDRYTLGQRNQPFRVAVEMINGNYKATLTTCLSKRTYVGHHKLEAPAKQRAAENFLSDPDVKALCEWFPPRQPDIRSKAVLYTKEKKDCRAYGVSQEMQNLIVRKRIDDVLAVFHEMGYRSDVWDGNF